PILERARSLMVETGSSYEDALVASSTGNVFTTHTPVAAGFDLFDPELVARYFLPYATEIGIPVERLVSFGQLHPGAKGELSNMAGLALRHSGSCNGVSQLHAEVSRRLFRPWFPRIPDPESPIQAVTNGIHDGSWMAQATADMVERYV